MLDRGKKTDSKQSKQPKQAKDDIIDAIQKDLRKDLVGLNNISRREIAAHLASVDNDISGDEIAEEILSMAISQELPSLPEAEDTAQGEQTLKEAEKPAKEKSEGAKKLDELRKDELQKKELQKKEVKASKAPKAIDSQVKIFVSSDSMSARILITQQKNGGKKIVEEDILDKLREKNIIKGIKFEYIYRLANYTVFDKKFKIAEGEKAIDGKDAEVKYNFKSVKEPESFEGKDDYAKIQYTKVKKGELLCEIIPETKGKSGWNILGNTLSAQDGKPLENISGSNTMLSDSRLYASCSGLVSDQEGLINVFTSMSFPAVLNNEVNFEGIVFVDGNVENSSVIKASGDIIVRGNVQNSTLVSGGSIILCKGVTGKYSVIKASGNIRSYFIENAKVYARGNITADVIMRAEVECGGTLTLSGERENLIGGSSRANEDIIARNIGNNVGVHTEIALIGNVQLHKEKQEAEERIEKYTKAIGQINSMQKALANTPADAKRKILAIRYTYSKTRLEKEIEEQQASIVEIDEKRSNAPSGKIWVKGHLYPDVQINIDGLIYENEREQRHCIITKRLKRIVFKSAL